MHEHARTHVHARSEGDQREGKGSTTSAPVVPRPAATSSSPQKRAARRQSSPALTLTNCRSFQSLILMTASLSRRVVLSAHHRRMRECAHDISEKGSGMAVSGVHRHRGPAHSGVRSIRHPPRPPESRDRRGYLIDLARAARAAPRALNKFHFLQRPCFFTVSADK
ncbi:hypothetical protein EVAR_66339_1 [Eumeta japonica]|uniref:Uncharacterized protein n=1 Tax=Eumeta variegata TaxID=151549 RepID=A0A4C2A6N5_EUMVA|nr:hypothetical protein EVAR_66339_1 [Eumeta japonica]